jgi:molybdenum cofactor synthesis domain-containing protein
VIPLEEVRDRILATCRPLPPCAVPLGEALGLVTAEDVVAGVDVPPFANTAMDGYAVRAADTAGAPVRLSVVGTLAAGSAFEGSVGPGQALRIMTGAPMPAGADAVVMVERTQALEGGSSVLIESSASPGDHVRLAGEDIRAGQRVFPAGTVLSAGHLGVLASLGLESVVVHPRARVGVLSTGDELADPGEGGEGGKGGELRPGQIRDSNRPTLLALVRQAGGEPVDLGRAGDDEAELAAVLEKAVAACDMVVTSGGVSVGDYDYVKAVLGRLGEVHTWQVAIKPAKPLAFASAGGRPVLGLPGNPVSAMVSFELFARPALRRLMGFADVLRPVVEGVAGEDLRRSPDGKLHLLRVVAAPEGGGGRLVVRSAGGQGSHLLRAMAAANALALVPDGPGVRAGERVGVLLLD